MCNIKTLCLLPNVLASEKANKVGAEECVQYRAEANGIKQRVTEGSHTNVHCIKDGVLYTAPLDNLILPGIARAHLIKACKKLGIPVSEVPYTVGELMNADEIIVSSSGSLCLAAEEIDGKREGGKAPELLKKLQDEVLREFIEATD
jgi:D-alanine transaminase